MYYKYNRIIKTSVIFTCCLSVRREGDSMATFSIHNKNVLKINEELNNEIYYGSNQEWYTKKWQRMSGCGPSTVANIIYYINRTRNLSSNPSDLTKNEILNLMNEIWNYVTPGLLGVSSTGRLCKGVKKYIHFKNMNINLDFLDIPKKKALRPEIQTVMTFLLNAIEMDSPVAFLNLDHGTIRELDSWHWVTIIALEDEQDETNAFVTILDGGLEKRINISEWLRSTKLGGGFVSFEP